LLLSIANTIKQNFHLAINRHHQTPTPTVVHYSRFLSHCRQLLLPIIDSCPQMASLPVTAHVVVPADGWLLSVSIAPHLIHLLPLCDY
jgi:hypothetical protein